MLFLSAFNSDISSSLCKMLSRAAANSFVNCDSSCKQKLKAYRIKNFFLNLLNYCNRHTIIVAQFYIKFSFFFLKEHSLIHNTALSTYMPAVFKDIYSLIIKDCIINKIIIDHMLRDFYS